ncbi:tRNA (adenosine(37)-N6)-threonylcarbamoyltransferase complex dimerization subunit type 1 TsaB [Roseomonas sp. BN140053]|uniref:tRNA (adenosine(37)-N6)-threonylcarbamoyltransferase complex dimerization subunit type 1 TsaB n=1 Tax=Roseomonas sp. BN140053 TaxID=3391898 RepID=UPI0039E9DE68
MRILALDGALARCSVALWQDGAVLGEAVVDGPRGHAAILPALVRDLLAASPGPCDAVAVTVGPGGFTGLRAAVSLARGLAAGWGVPCLGITVGEALAEALPAELRARRALWTAVDTKRGRVALERPGEAPAVFTEDALPAAPGPVAVAGDAALPVAARLLARGTNALLTDARLPRARDVAAVAARVLRDGTPQRPAEPLYLEPPAVRP